MNDQHPLEHQVEKTIRDRKLIAPGERILVGVSGGLDSMALLSILVRLSSRLDCQLHIAHLNHGWRGRDSANDARFVKAACRQLDLACDVEKLDAQNLAKKGKGGREAQGRHARYAFFYRLARLRSCQRVAVAHHRDDLAETILINLLRGSGPRGLLGFEARATNAQLTIIRPLIEVSREALANYCHDRRLRWREDQSNSDHAFLRNRVRLELLPALESGFNPRFREALLRLADILRTDEEWADELARQKYQHFHRPAADQPPRRIPLGFIQGEAKALVRRCLRFWLTELRSSGHPPPLAAVDDMIEFVQKVDPGGLLHSLDSLVFRKTRRHLELISHQPGQRIRRK